MTSSASFSPNVLGSYANLCQFLEGKKAIAEIEQEAQFLSLSTVKKIHRSGVQILVQTQNIPSLDSRDVDGHPPILFCSINDPKVAKRTFAYYADGFADNEAVINAKGEKIVSFNNSEGVCRGMSEWFVYLYFSTLKKFSDPTQHFTAVAKQFENGAPSEAVLIQNLCIKKGKMIGLKIEYDAYKICDDNSGLGKKITRRIINKIPPGVYTVRFPEHQCVYVKLNKNLSFYFDPNKDAEAYVDTPYQVAPFVDALFQSNDDGGKIFLNRVSLREETKPKTNGHCYTAPA